MEMNWIPVSERLPYYNSECIVTYHYWYNDKEASVLTGTAEFNGMQWFIHGRSAEALIYEKYPLYVLSNGRTPEGTKVDVVAWMPLPEPYRKDGENES